MASADRPQAVSLAEGWSPASWRDRAASQLPVYPDPAALAQAMDELRALPPLVTSWEILALKQQVAEAQEGRRFKAMAWRAAERADFLEQNRDGMNLAFSLDKNEWKGETYLELTVADFKGLTD